MFGIHIFQEYSVYTMSAQGIHIFQNYSIYTMSCTFRFQRVVIHIFQEYSRLMHDVNGECGKEGKTTKLPKPNLVSTKEEKFGLKI